MGWVLYAQLFVLIFFCGLILNTIINSVIRCWHREKRGSDLQEMHKG